MHSKDDQLIQLHRTFFWQSEKFIKSNKWEDLDELYSSLPADQLHVNDRQTMALLYVDPNMRKVSGLNQENLAKKGMEQIQKRIDPENFQRNVEIATQFVKRGNKHEIGVLFQCMDMSEDMNGNFEWFISFMELSDKAKGIFTLDFKIRFLDRYQNKFMKLITLDEFVHKNMDKFQELTAREIEIMTKVAQGESSQEISDELFISKLTVDTHRKNIMSKLGINRFVDLIRFAEAFDMV